MVLHIFSFESEALAERAGGKSMEAQAPRGTRRVRGYNWKGPRASLRGRGKEPGYAARTVLLRWNASSGARETTASGTLGEEELYPWTIEESIGKTRGCSPKRGGREWAIRTARRSSRDITRPSGRRF